MSKNPRLYDLEQKDYPNKRGDEFCCLQVFVCPICGAQSNLVIMGGYPGFGLRVVCPNSAECWHHEIEARVRRRQQFGHPASYYHELDKEIAELKTRSANLVQSDIVDEPDFNQVRLMTNIFSRKLNDPTCPHGFGSNSGS